MYLRPRLRDNLISRRVFATLAYDCAALDLLICENEKLSQGWPAPIELIDPISADDMRHWAQDGLDSRWAALIQRACDERPEPSLKVKQKADPDEFKVTLDFIKYALTTTIHA
ncbi:MAG: hypothetical protein ACRDHG_14240 [Anaerolineales bacterium]